MNKLPLIVTAIALMTGAAHAGNPPSWDDIPHYKCSEIIGNDGSQTRKTVPVLIWLAGYREGIAALAALDKRLSMIPADISLSVLVGCENAPTRSLDDVVVSIFAMMINALPGPGGPLTLAVPGP